ncbi:MAG: hypothetical protein QM621_08095 [Aeromicrobium sp.]|uniref:hypothetical protein n=1 Tax=Aeromicrobium sp. TaxID=1871063 RepID=UPI0039E2CC67
MDTDLLTNPAETRLAGQLLAETARLATRVRSEYQPNITPNTDWLPGINLAEGIAGSVQSFALVGCVTAIVIGGLMMAFGPMMGHGKSRMIGLWVALSGFCGGILVAASNAILGSGVDAGGQA